jgi:glycosyltransferase involved in cell wall biosynthesis
MKITYVSTYPPRECGLATFNKNLMGAISSNLSANRLEEQVIALNADGHNDYEYPSEVKMTIRQQELEDYDKAANFINLSDTDAVILQHEFGIFGGETGIYVLPFIYQLEKPLITILHTVLKSPSYQQKVIIQTIAKRSEKVIVMGKIAIKFLKEVYDIPADKIGFIEHGVPDKEAPELNPVKADPMFKGRKILLTFGLISRNKGLETVVRALPKIAENHPDVLYMILGNTHPGILKNSGEEYREYLVELAEELNVKDKLVFVNRYVAEDDLINYLSAADVYVTPYLNEAQVTSGTLAYAVGAGAAVVSTPYWHAKELLDGNRGRLFNFKDEDNLSDIINELLDDPYKLTALKTKAYNYGLNLRWPVIGRKYIDVVNTAIRNVDLADRSLKRTIDIKGLPEFSLDYVNRLTDSTGIIQHAKYGIPNWKEGYCIDDNSRALIMALMANELNYDGAIDLLPNYLGFIHYLQNDDGSFRNFLSYSREYLDEIGSEDAFGRTIWSLGYLINHAPSHSYREFGQELFCKAIPHFKNLRYLRGIANTLIGVTYYLKTHPGDPVMQKEMNRLTALLVEAYRENEDDAWHWYENYLTYDNAILPLALLHSAEITENVEVYDIAFKSISFLEALTLKAKYLNPVGNNGFYFKNGKMPLYDQQAIETMAMGLMYAQAYKMTKDAKYLKRIYAVHSWFLGENSLWAPLYDADTKGCSDGLQLRGVNRNQGAESTLAYLISYLAVLQSVKSEQSHHQESRHIGTEIMLMKKIAS